MTAVRLVRRYYCLVDRLGGGRASNTSVVDRCGHYALICSRPRQTLARGYVQAVRVVSCLIADATTNLPVLCCGRDFMLSTTCVDKAIAYAKAKAAAKRHSQRWISESTRVDFHTHTQREVIDAPVVTAPIYDEQLVNRGDDKARRGQVARGRAKLQSRRTE